MIIAGVSPSTLETANTILGLLAVIAQVAVAALLLLWLAGLVFAPARSLLSSVRFALQGSELWIAFAVALAAMAGSLFYSELASFPPCRLCWFQRICMYPLVPLLLAMAIRRDRRGSLFYVLPLTVVGSLVSIYHLYIEANPEAETTGCKMSGSCATKWVEVFGYITIPAFALTAFALISAMVIMAGTRSAQAAAPDSSEPDAGNSEA